MSTGPKITISSILTLNPKSPYLVTELRSPLVYTKQLLMQVPYHLLVLCLVIRPGTPRVDQFAPTILDRRARCLIFHAALTPCMAMVPGRGSVWGLQGNIFCISPFAHWRLGLRSAHVF
jgi:hypothetical protein